MDENNVVVTNNEPTETTEPVKTEPKKDEKPVSAEVERLKAALSKANGEAAEYKRQLREKQTEAERAEAERLEAEKAKDARLAELERTVEVNDCINGTLSLGFEADNAAKFANAWYDHDKNAMFVCLKAFVEATTTRLQNEALNRQPGLSTGIPPSTNTVDKETNDMRRWAGLPPIK